MCTAHTVLHYVLYCTYVYVICIYCFSVLVISNYLSEEDIDYLSQLFDDFGTMSFIIETAYLKYLSKTLSQKHRACIHGPKGVGKTHSLLYLACRVKEAEDEFVAISKKVNNHEYLSLLGQKYSKVNFTFVHLSFMYFI